jgi:hypothetical protein
MKKIKSSNSTVINQNGHLLQTFDETSDTSSVAVGCREKRKIHPLLEVQEILFTLTLFFGRE